MDVFILILPLERCEPLSFTSDWTIACEGDMSQVYVVHLLSLAAICVLVLGDSGSIRTTLAVDISK